MYGLPKINWGALTKDLSLRLGEKLQAMGSWMISGEASSMWTSTMNCIQEATREVLELRRVTIVLTKGTGGGMLKKTAYLKLVESKDEAKLAITEAKTAAFSRLVMNLGPKAGTRIQARQGKGEKGM